MTKRLGFDLDGVVYDFNTPFNEFMERNGYKLKNSKVYNMGDRYAISQKLAGDQIDFFSQSSEMLNLRMFDDAKEALEFLALDNELYFITSRKIKPKIVGNTIKRLTRDNLLETNDHVIFSRTGNKGKFCNALGLDYFIDDYYKNLLDIFNDSDTKPVIMTREYNKDFKLNGIDRVDCWADLLMYLR